MFERLRVADAGDASLVPGSEIESLAMMEAAVAEIVAAGAIPCGIGGDHSVTLAELRAVADRHGPLSLIHFDSHSDTWDRYFDNKRYSAGTMFRRGVEEEIVDPAHSIQIGLRGSLFQPDDVSQSEALGYRLVTCDEMYEIGFPALAALIAERSAGRPAFLTFDPDFVDPAFAPGVETPEAGGPSARQTLGLLRASCGVNLVGCDVVRLNPSFDGPGQITALPGATVMAEILAITAVARG